MALEELVSIEDEKTLDLEGPTTVQGRVQASVTNATTGTVGFGKQGKVSRNVPSGRYRIHFQLIVSYEKLD